MSPYRRRVILIGVVLALATLAIYWQVRQFDFVNYDDWVYVSENPRVQRGMTVENFQWALTTTYFTYWHPLTWMSHMIDCHLFGLNAGAHHLTNVAFHIANTLLLFLVFYRMTGRLERSAFVAALFAVHPLHVESVAWIAERKDVLSTFFWLLTMYLYAVYVNRPGLGRYLLALVCFALGLMAKPMLVTLPFVLLLMDYWPLGRLNPFAAKNGPGGKLTDSPARIVNLKSFGRVILEKVPFLALMVISSIITWVSTKGGGHMLSVQELPFSLRLANVPISYVRYLGKMLFMEDMAVLYPFPKYWEAWQVAGACFLLLSITVLAIMSARRRPYLIVGWLWFLGTLVPTISLVAVGFQSIADRYTYVSLIGIFVMAVWAAADFLQRWPIPRIALQTAGIAVCLICSAVTIRQLAHWQNSLALWTHALAVTKDNAIAHYNLGYALTSLGRFRESLPHYEEAVRIKPDYIDANLNLGATLMQLGRVQEATNCFANAIRVKPDFDEAHNYMGSALLALGDVDGAASQFTQALAVNSTNSVTHYNLGLALSRQGNSEKAIKHFSESLRWQPGSAETHFQLGLAYLSQRQAKEAVLHYREALRLRPHFIAALNNLAWLLATHPDPNCRNGPEAVGLAEKACELTAHKQPLLLGTLAAAYAETGDFNRAIRTAQTARDLAETSGDKTLADKNDKLLEKYRAGKPHRETEPL